jgi:hypothetical protein
MKNILSITLFSLPLLAACTQETIVKKVPPAETPAEGQPEGSTDGTEPGTDGTDGEPAKPTTLTADNCLDGQDMDAADIDVSACPEIPTIPDDAPMAGNKKDMVSLGAWEIGTTKEGDTYVYGTLSKPGTTPRTLSFDGGKTEVNAENLECWAKGYYRLRKILQDPPAEYVALRKAGFQYRFFQFQTDLRNGPTGYKGLASFQDHLVKWVTVISKTGTCQQPTLSKFREYAAGELKTRGLPAPGGS